MPKNRRNAQRAHGANFSLRVRTVHMYPVFAYKPGEPDPEPAHVVCHAKTVDEYGMPERCGAHIPATHVPFGPLPACPKCGAALKHDHWVPDEKPIDFITKELKREWLELRYVSSHCRGSVLRMKLLLPPRPQVSVTTLGILDGLVMNKPYARAVVEAWRGEFREAAPHWSRYGLNAEALRADVIEAAA